jgi:putative inorganic carbon (hco3(-)) transporter
VTVALVDRSARRTGSVAPLLHGVLRPQVRNLTRLAAVLVLGWALARGPIDLVAVTAVAIAIWVLPVLGLACAAFAVPLASLRPLPVGPGSLTVTPLLLAWTALPWLLAALMRRRVPGLRIPLVWPLVAFLTALAAAAWRAPDVAQALFEVARWVELGLALVLAVALVRDRRTARVLLLAVLAAGVTAALVGIAMALGRVGPEAFAILGGRLYRAYGTFGQPNPFGGYMNMVWPVGVGLVVGSYQQARIRHQSRGCGYETGRMGRDGCSAGRLSAWWAVAGIVVTAVTGAGLVLSWSRGAWLAAAVGAAAMGLTWLVGSVWPRVRQRNLALLAVVVVGLVVVSAGGGAARVPAAVAGRLGSVADTFTVWGVRDAEVDDASFATIERVAHWEAAVAMWRDRPWLGQGPGHYALAYARYRLPRWSEPLGHAHNTYLQMLAEAGLVGLAGYLLFFVACARVALGGALRPRSPLHGALGLGLVGVLAALAFHGLVDFLYVHETTVHLGLLLGLTVGAGRAS